MLIHLQLHAEWNAVIRGCIVFNSARTRLNVIVSFIHDTTLLLAMLVGLLRIRGQSGGAFEMGRLLWRQVEWLLVPSAATLSVG